MWRTGLRLAGRFAGSLLGAAALAAILSALPSHGAGLLGLGRSAWADIVAMGHFDLGTSAVTARPVATELARSLPATLELVGFGAIIAFLIGTPVGLVLSAGRVLRAGAPLIQIVAAAPVFCAGLGLLWLSARVLNWTGAPRAVALVTAMGHANRAEFEAALRAIALPALTVGIAGAAGVQLALRRAIGHALAEPYREGLRAMGLGRFEIDRLYVTPQVVAGLLRSLGEIASTLLAAAAVAEWVFGWPGAAILFLKSVALDDWTVAAGVLLAFSAFTLGIEFAGRICALAVSHSEADA